MSDFRGQADLSDPKQLLEECKSLAQALFSQAEAARAGSALGGHPNPQWFYGRCGEVLHSCAAYLTVALAPKEEPKPEEKIEATRAKNKDAK